MAGLTRPIAAGWRKCCSSDPAAVEYYQDYLDVHVLLHWQHGLAEEQQACGEPRARSDGRGEEGLSPVSAGSPSARDGDSAGGPCGVLDDRPTANVTCSSVGPPHSPFLIQHSSSSELCAVLVRRCRVDVRLGHPGRLGMGRASRTGNRLPCRTRLAAHPTSCRGRAVVGKVTAMVNCQWADSNNTIEMGADVNVRRVFALASGILEITYENGAKVVLEGPALFSADSHNSGLLLRGKLTAHTKKVADRPLFCVHSPTAVVTERGDCQFGMDVDRAGEAAFTSSGARWSINCLNAGHENIPFCSRRGSGYSWSLRTASTSSFAQRETSSPRSL